MGWDGMGWDGKGQVWLASKLSVDQDSRLGFEQLYFLEAQAPVTCQIFGIPDLFHEFQSPI